ncbi:MAG TPA: MBOAT family O-acyltransferase, partial [Limnochordales bacterium]|nr:MBOAT family O-acyltransferase [Limnochordales bacterium]
FPKLLAGPIERAKPFLEQLAAPIRLDPQLVASGLQLMLWGLIKKTVIADNLAEFVNNAFLTPAFQSPVTLLVAVYLYAFQIYCDFSGYSDIAIGSARVLGIQLMNNFKRPYLAKSVAEFWSQRWHISLSRWFRDYLYIPLGGNRVPWWRVQLNLLIVFLVSGLWHGANWTFVIWGGLNGLYQIVFRLLQAGWDRLKVPVRPPSWLSGFLNTLITFHLITLSWVFFRASSVQEAWTILTRISGSFQRLPMLLSVYNWSSQLRLLFAMIAVLLLVEIWDEQRPVRAWLARQPAVIRWGVYYGAIALLLTLGKWGFEEFVYMQF